MSCTADVLFEECYILHKLAFLRKLAERTLNHGFNSVVSI